jgi:hypothetical protein
MASLTERPALDERPAPEVFLKFYYLKEELLAFCRTNGLGTSGSKTDLTSRVESFLRTGRVPEGATTAADAPARRRTTPPAAVAQEEPALDAQLGPNFKCTEERRSFFESQVGRRFHFSVKLQRYLRSNPKATYADAIAEWRRLDAARSGPAQDTETDQIDPQFEYNRYIRAFFADNPGLKLNDAIACWRFRRGLPGERTYTRADLSTLGDRDT